jgi:serine protease Do
MVFQQSMKFVVPAALALAGLALSIPAAALDRPPTVPTTDEAKSIFADARSRIYQIRTLTSDGDAQATSGSGFLVGEDGLIATNWHVVAVSVLEPDLYRLEVRRTDNTRLPARVVAIDATNDLALIRVKGEKGAPFPIRQAPLAKGEKAFSIGNPQNIGFTVVEGTFNGVQMQSIQGHLHFTGAINGGMSGGPGLTRDGEVFGVNVSRRTDGSSMGFLVPADRLSALLSRARAENPSSQALLEEARQGMILAQDKVTASAITANPGMRQIGHFRFPVQPEAISSCSGSTSKEEDDGYTTEWAYCMTDFAIIAGRKHAVALMAAQYNVVRNLSLDDFRFAARVSDLATKDKDDKGEKKVVGKYRCRTSYVQLKGGTARTTLCTRPYVKFKGLHDAHLQIVTVDSSEEALIGDLILYGFTQENIKRLGRWYLESIEWKR